MNAAPSARLPVLRRRPMPLNPLALGAVLLLGSLFATGARAQSLVQLYEAARGFDATYLSARSQYDASLAQAAQARAGLLPQAGLGAVASWARRDISGSSALSGSSDNQSATLSASQPLYRPVNKLTNDQAELSVDIAKARLTQAGLSGAQACALRVERGVVVLGGGDQRIEIVDRRRVVRTVLSECEPAHDDG